MDNCSNCGNELHGELETEVIDLPIGSYIRTYEKSKRNWILCDSCNVLLCHGCCRHPKTGYSDRCIEKYDLITDEDVFPLTYDRDI